MVIKSRALKLRDYKESRIIALIYIHIVGEKLHITLSSIF